MEFPAVPNNWYMFCRQYFSNQSDILLNGVHDGVSSSNIKSGVD
jgi:hypothetical protein